MIKLTFVDRFIAAIELICKATPDKQLVIDWLNNNDNDSLQDWIGATKAPWWLQSIGVLDMAYTAASNPVEGEHDLIDYVNPYDKVENTLIVENALTRKIYMKSDQEILDKLEEYKDKDFFGVIHGDLATRLPFELAKLFLKEDLLEIDYVRQPRDRDSVIDQMRDYISFAWDKANSGRGLSAGRSLDHFTAWIWLLGDDANFPDLQNYNYYGKDHLVKICEFYGFTNEDNGIREN